MSDSQSSLVAMPVMDIAQAVQRRVALVEFCKGIMVEGVDYGTIPGTNKPTLLKPGAEKLTTFFGLTVRFISIECVDDWTGENHGGETFFSDWYRCQLWKGDRLIAEADGECNSRESKYRWRWVAEEDVPLGLDKANLKRRSGSRREMQFAVEKAETSGKYGKPAEYWQGFKDAIAAGTAQPVQIKTRKGKTYQGWEIDSTVYRVPNEDIASQRNTIKKMSQKRAFVGATLIGVNASEFYTQDLEDMAADLGISIKDIDADTGTVIEGTVVKGTKPTSSAPSGPPEEPPWGEGMQQAPPAQNKAEPGPPPPQANGTVRPAPPAKVKEWLVKAALTGAKSDISPETLKAFHASMALLFPDADAATIDQNRHLLCQFVFNKASSKSLKEGEARAVNRWASHYVEETQEYMVNEHAPQEAIQIVNAARDATRAGQQRLV